MVFWVTIKPWIESVLIIYETCKIFAEIFSSKIAADDFDFVKLLHFKVNLAKLPVDTVYLTGIWNEKWKKLVAS